MAPQESSWPGEREPSQQDVEVATAQPQLDVLPRFRKALLSSPEASNTQDLMHLDFNNHIHDHETLTYPVAFLLSCPALPSQGEISYLRQVFSASCSGHTMINLLSLPPASREPIVPPLRLAMASIASVHAGREEAESRNLFRASLSLWGAMVEIDNTEARSPEMLTGATLAAIYGALGAEKWVHDRAGLLVSCSLTAARRMRFHDSSHLEALLDRRASSYSAASLWCLWFASILQALHCDVACSSFSPKELWTGMPSSSYEFQDMYRLLVQSGNDSPLPSDLTSPNDAFLLLLAVLSDCLCLNQSLGRIAAVADFTVKQASGNPFSTLSPHSEFTRMRNVLSSALRRWHSAFQASISSDILALYHYCRMYLSCFQLLELPRMAGYKLMSPGRCASSGLLISNECVSQAWLVLDNAAAHRKASSPQSLCPAWLPIVVFHAGLVLWARQTYGNGIDDHAYGSIKVLLPFRVELEHMTWPCCKEMAATLDRLMDNTAVGRA